MNPLFTKFFWKLHFRRKKAEWNVFLIESKKQLSKNKFKYLLWLLKRNPKNSRFAVKKVKKRWLFYKPRYIGIFLKSSKKPRWAIIGFTFLVVFWMVAQNISSDIRQIPTKTSKGSWRYYFHKLARGFSFHHELHRFKH